MSQRPEIVLVAAMGRNRVIGVDGGMPWHLPADLRHFKAVTLGHPMVMGRRTFESIGRALPGRRNIVLSTTMGVPPAGVEVFDSFARALDTVDDDSVMVVGGGALYRDTLPRADRLELTLVDAEPDGDTRFPDWNRHEWALRRMQRRPADDANPYALVFCTFVRSASTTVRAS